MIRFTANAEEIVDEGEDVRESQRNSEAFIVPISQKVENSQRKLTLKEECCRMNRWNFLTLLSLVSCIVSIVLFITAKQAPKYAKSCRDLTNDESGIYLIRPDPFLPPIEVYCDMSSVGGGWTLVAAVHENDILSRCGHGDLWSSQQGEMASTQKGDGNWLNERVFGKIEDITHGDYKNIAYFNMPASNVMIWHVPNNLRFHKIKDEAIFMYYTDDNILDKYGKTLKNLFSEHATLKDPGYNRFHPMLASPIKFIKGNMTEMMENIPSAVLDDVEPGYLQFRAFDNDGGAYALCPGFKIYQGNVPQVCIGAANSLHMDRCGDFAGWYGKWFENGNRLTPVDRLARQLRDLKSSILIFTK